MEINTLINGITLQLGEKENGTVVVATKTHKQTKTQPNKPQKTASPSYERRNGSNESQKWKMRNRRRGGRGDERQGEKVDRDKWPWEMACAGEPASETALSAALTQTDRPTGLCYHSTLSHSCLILPSK